MEHEETERLRLVTQLLDAKSQSTAAMQQYFALLREHMGGGMLHMREIHFILAVGPGEGKTMSQLAEQLGVSQGAVSQTAARLEEKGHILRRRNPSNYRQIIATLTESGEQAYHHHLTVDRAVHANMDKTYLYMYSDEELAFLRDYELWMSSVFATINNRIAQGEANLY